MYNEDLKKRFIAYYTNKPSTAYSLKNIFNVIEKYEEKWQADMCTKSAQELEPAIEEICGIRKNSQYTTVYSLRKYVRWCIDENVPGACDGIFHVRLNGLKKFKTHMVSTPLYLQRKLDDIFEPEGEETIDNLYRCACWLAYSGVNINDICSIRKSDVDLKNRVIQYHTVTVPIYNEGFASVKNSKELTSFAYKHPNYGNIIRRDRIEDEALMSGIKTILCLRRLQFIMSTFSKDAVGQGKTDTFLSLSRLYYSGWFYRLYERECAGYPISFSEMAEQSMRREEYKCSKKGMIKLMSIHYREDYNTWKLAFFP